MGSCSHSCYRRVESSGLFGALWMWSSMPRHGCCCLICGVLPGSDQLAMTAATNGLLASFLFRLVESGGLFDAIWLWRFAGADNVSPVCLLGVGPFWPCFSEFLPSVLLMAAFLLELCVVVAAAFFLSGAGLRSFFQLWEAITSASLFWVLFSLAGFFPLLRFSRRGFNESHLSHLLGCKWLTQVFLALFEVATFPYQGYALVRLFTSPLLFWGRLLVLFRFLCFILVAVVFVLFFLYSLLFVNLVGLVIQFII